MDQKTTTYDETTTAPDDGADISNAAPPTKTPSAEANAKMAERTLGCVAFESYCRATGGATYDGKQIPPWPGLPAQVQLAWEAAAKAVAARVAPPRSAEDAQ